MEKPTLNLTLDGLESTGKTGLVSSPPNELRAGDTCPACGKARLDYNGLLELACPNCGYSQGGGCT